MVWTRCQKTRRGLTLMELVVVMAVLAALAAIVIPMFPNLLRRAHKVTDCTQTNEMAKNIQLYNALYYGYPDGFDLLTDGASATESLTTLPGFASATGPFGGMTTLSKLSDIPVQPGSVTALQALQAVGIKNGAAMSNTGTQWHPTMWPYADPATAGNPITPAQPLADATVVRILNNTGINNNNPRFLAIARQDPNAQFVVFGVGPKCAMVGRNIQDAPTSVPQKSDFTPDNTYSRVGVIFQVAGAAVDAGDGRAIFVASCALEDDELESTEKDIIGYYQVARNPGQ